MKENSLLAIVVAIKANYFFVEIGIKSLKNNTSSSIKDANLRFLCTARNRINYQGEQIKVGDLVLIESIDWINFKAVISQVQPRTNYMIRPSVANVDKIFLVFSCKRPDFDIDQVTRFLITAEQIDLDICILLSKSDLLSEQAINSQLKRIKTWGYDSLSVSVKSNNGINTLIDRISSFKISLFCGPSGVGKTSLINKLLPHVRLPEGNLSKKLQRGSNTTRHVELFSLANESRIADTPGFNRPDIMVGKENLQWTFPEIKSQLLQKRCKFRNCLHKDELGCEINKDWERYSIYRRYLDKCIKFPRPYQED